MNLESPLEELRTWYGESVREHLGDAYSRDMALPLCAAQWLERAAGKGKMQVVEFGAGFSTLVFCRALLRTQGTLLSLDHDAEWISFMRRTIARLDGPAPVDFETTHEFLARPEVRDFDFVFIDHGPTYTARAATLAPILACCRRVGCTDVVLDDWHTSPGMQHLYRAPVTQIARLLGCEVVEIEDSSPPNADRGLARVRAF